MSQIGDTENALLGLLRTCQLPTGVHIGSAPSQWDQGFVQRLIPSTPAICLRFSALCRTRTLDPLRA